MTKARDISKLLSTANGKIAGENLDVSFENISDTGTEGTKVASGTTAQRGSTAGQFRFNSTTGKFEGFNGSAFKELDSPPTVSSVSPDNFESSALPSNITITGVNFSSGDTVNFIGNDGTSISSGSVTINSSTQITAQVPNSLTSDNEPYDVRVTNSSGLASTLNDCFNIDASPVFSVASGSIGTLSDVGRQASNLTAITATDDEGDAITFSQTAGTLPTGITLNSDGTWSGTANSETSDTTYSFTIQASDGTNTSSRSYTITVNAPIATGGDVIDSYDDGGTTYVYHQFNSNGTFNLTTAKTVDYLLVGGGGGGGNTNSGGGDGAGGGGAGGYIYLTSQSLSAGSYSAVVGNGGSPQGGGVSSSFNGYTAGGGGNGGFDESSGGSGANTNGSGGGAGCRNTSPGSGTGTGNNGGNGGGDSGGGGGGSSGNGQNAPSASEGGDGGAGTSNSITGTAVIYAVGGGGGVQNPGGTPGVGSADGGGLGGDGSNAIPTAGTANRGNGGGGAGSHYASTSGASGGSGVVIVRYAA